MNENNILTKKKKIILLNNESNCLQITVVLEICKLNATLVPINQKKSEFSSYGLKL